MQILLHEKMQIISLCSKLFTLKYSSVQHVYGRLTENGKVPPDENLSYDLKTVTRVVLTSGQPPNDKVRQFSRENTCYYLCGTTESLMKNVRFN